MRHEHDKLSGLAAYLRWHTSRLSLPAYLVCDDAPSDHVSLLECYRQTGKLKIWAGASDCTVWGGAADNWLFRAWHDYCHIGSGMCDKVDCFTADREIELSDWQSNGCSTMLGRIVGIEIAGQASHYKRTGNFVEDQIRFATDRIGGNIPL